MNHIAAPTEHIIAEHPDPRPGMRVSDRIYLNPWRLFTDDFIPNQLLIRLQLAQIQPQRADMHINEAVHSARNEIERILAIPAAALEVAILQEFLRIQTLQAQFDFLCHVKNTPKEDLLKESRLWGAMNTSRTTAEDLMTTSESRS